MNASDEAAASGAFGRRVRRACDHCNRGRRRCDGDVPCGYCVRTARICQYERPKKKRGRAKSCVTSPGFGSSASPTQVPPISPSFLALQELVAQPNPSPQGEANLLPIDWAEDYATSDLPVDWTAPDLDGAQTSLALPADWDWDAFQQAPYPDLSHPHEGAVASLEHSLSQCESSVPRPDSPGMFGPLDPLPQLQAMSRRGNPDPYKMSTSQTDRADGGSPWPNPPSTVVGFTTTTQRSESPQYPVLNDLLPMLEELMPESLPSDLLGAYFETFPGTDAPKIAFVPHSIFQKSSFLRQDNPRKSGRALLASMLWLSAQKANIPWLNANIGRRKHIRRQLLQLTTRLLKPLTEVVFGGLGESRDKDAERSWNSEQFDDILAYIHLAMVTTASEFKGASLRWWSIAFSLAREINLHRSLPNNRSTTPDSTSDILATLGDDRCLAKEREEERLRSWWFLYTMDRHISITFNKPLSLLDSECLNLQRPTEHRFRRDGSSPMQQERDVTSSGPIRVCTGPSFFEFFTPVASILGEIVYFVQAQNHPRMGISPNTLTDWKLWEKGIAEQLSEYQDSLTLLTNHMDVGHKEHDGESPSTLDTGLTTHTMRLATRYAMTRAYGNFLVNAMRILLSGKWDPLTVLDRSASWFASSSFRSVLECAFHAADELERILQLDPNLNFMSFYLDIYLLQGSLPLILVADRLKSAAGDLAVRACRSFVRAHEICVINRPNEHQTVMLAVLRAALLEMEGRAVDDEQDLASERRHLLSKYNWTREGRGLAH